MCRGLQRPVESVALQERSITCVTDARVEIIFPEEGRLRSRTVVSRSRARPTGKYPSWKMARMIQWESPNELNALRLLDASPAVTAFHEQPLAIRFVLDGEPRLHYPDLFVAWSDGRRELWEVKPEREAAHPYFAARTRYLQAALPALGYSYRLAVAEELAREPRLTNALTLLKYGRNPIRDADRERIRRILLSAPALRWGSALRGDLGPQGLAQLSRLALEGFLSFDIERELAEQTPFTLATQGNSR